MQSGVRRGETFNAITRRGTIKRVHGEYRSDVNNIVLRLIAILEYRTVWHVSAHCRANTCVCVYVRTCMCARAHTRMTHAGARL